MMSGTAFNDMISQELARHALKGLITKTALNPAEMDYLCMGTVIQEGACGGGNRSWLHTAVS